MAEVKKFYKVSEVAKIFGVSNRTVRIWLDKGEKFPNARKDGEHQQGHWYIPDSDIQAYAQKEYGS